MRHFDIIVAVDQDNGIGKDGKLPWHLKGDLAHFKEITTSTKDPTKQNAVIMGRKTWESLPEKFRPLSNRINFVLSKQPQRLDLPADVFRAQSLEEALEEIANARLSQKIESVFVIGGGQIFEEAIKLSHCRRIHLTKILSNFACQNFFPKIPRDFKVISKSEIFRENTVSYYFSVLEK